MNQQTSDIRSSRSLRCLANSDGVGLRVTQTTLPSICAPSIRHTDDSASAAVAISIHANPNGNLICYTQS
jgi:adenine C2-methylase RlmN of 23S rRNA A2503 and tRNA A37